MVTTLYGILDHGSSEFKNLPAVGYVDDTSISYNELKNKAECTAAFLTGKGIQPGDHIAILSENSPWWVSAYFGISAKGAVAVPILPDFSDAEVANILDHSQAKGVFVSKSLRLKIPENFPFYPIEEITEFKEKNPDTIHRMDEDDIATIIYTSGTTGSSKGVVLTHRNLISNAIGAAPLASMKKGESMLSVLPLSHTYECTLGLLTPLIQGVSVNYLRRPPSASVLLPALQKVRPHLMLSVPMLIEKLYRQKVAAKFSNHKLFSKIYPIPMFRKILHKLAGKALKKTFGGRLHFFGIGGAPLATDVEVFLKEANFPYAIGYGMTETSPLIAGASPAMTRIGSTGKVLKELEIRLKDKDPETGEGEIQVKGPFVMKGYYRDEEKTKEILDDEGWLSTGDLGILDSTQTLFIKGRKKNMILGPNGENIYPEAIEGLFNKCDFVEDSLVYQDPDKGGLVAKIHINYDQFTEGLEKLKSDSKEIQEKVLNYLADIRSQVNTQLGVFSRIRIILEEKKPFIKTPTKKIKRYLYIPEKQA